MARLTKPLDPSTHVDIALSDAVARWLVSLEAENRAPRTIGQYRYALGVVQDVLGPLHVLDLQPESIDGLIVTLKQRGWKPATVSSVERPLRTFLKWCVGRRLLAESPMDGRKPVAVPVEPVQYPTPDELRRVIATTTTRSKWAFRARRDRAILLMFATTGLRLAELAELRLSDIRLDDRYPTITVMGKGRKVRTLPLDEPTAESLRTYMTLERPRSPHSGSATAVWLAPRGPMTHSGVAQMVADRGASVGVDLHPHALRHYAIDQMLRSGLSEGDCMRVTGHSTRAMLDRYAAALGAERADEAFRATSSRRAALL